MNRNKKVIAVVMALVLMFSLSACTGFGGKMAKSAQKMQEVKSFRMDLDMDIGMSMSMSGESMDLDMDMAGTMDVFTDPVHMKADLSLNLMGEPMDILLYMDSAEENQVLNTYFSVDDGETWSKTEINIPNTEDAGKLDVKDLAWLTKIASSFEETGTEVIKGSEATVYTGAITGSDLQALLNSEEAQAALAESATEDFDLSALDLSQISDIPITICIDNEKETVVKFSVDLTDMIQTLVPVIMQAAMSSELGGMDLSELGIEFNVGQLILTAVIYDFDAVEDFEIPSEALAAEVAA